jgi:16S rRNA (guanine966-N2)-methyltransferase
MIPSYFKLLSKKTMSSKLRITAGSLKGRSITWDFDHIRPTPCMMRQRLFNWLQFDIKGKHCLDLFSGTGILGIEALSRGASHVTFIDQHQKTCQNIEKNLTHLNLETHTIINRSIPTTLSLSPDYIFCDPPYDFQGTKSLLRWLDTNFKGAILYYECKTPPKFPENWHVLKTAKQGQCLAHLIEINHD